MKKTVKLTENDIQKIIKETVNEMLTNEDSLLLPPTNTNSQGKKPLGRALSPDDKPKKEYYGYMLNPDGKAIKRKIGEAVKNSINSFLMEKERI